MNNSPFTTHSKDISSGAKAKTKKMPQEQETRGFTSHVEPPKKGKRGRKPDSVKKAEKDLERSLKKSEREKRKKERAEYKKKMREYAKEYNRMQRAISKVERKDYENWWKQNTKSDNQKARDTKREALKEAKKREQAARKAEMKEFRNLLKDIKQQMKTWATKDNLSQDALKAVLKQIPGVALTDKGNISAARSDRRNDEMKQALQNMLKDSKSFSKALQNSPFWNTDRKRLLWYRIFVDTFDKDKLSPLKWGSLGYQEIVEKWDELEFAVIQNNLILATQLMDELDKLMDEVQRKIDAGDVTEDYNYDDDYDNF